MYRVRGGNRTGVWPVCLRTRLAKRQPTVSGDERINHAHMHTHRLIHTQATDGLLEVTVICRFNQQKLVQAAASASVMKYNPFTLLVILVVYLCERWLGTSCLVAIVINLALQEEML